MRAITPNSPIKTPGAIRQIIELNVMALMDLSQKAATYMRARRSGQILQISSVPGFCGNTLFGSLCRKQACRERTGQDMKYELRGTGVRDLGGLSWAYSKRIHQQSVGAGDGQGGIPTGEPTTRVVRAILRGLDDRRIFLVPSWTAWAGLKVAEWCPPLYDWFVSALGNAPRRFSS